ncbi:MAG: N-acetylmuramoyl-L-alanine amidase [Bacteroidaceae bacterium]|nr:N-acetylmuramoyl-L-alanine amidase [Bacteroidaceae bacterium]
MRRALTYIFLVFSLLMTGNASAYTLVIDAGHGGKDAGALGFISKEKDINLAIALEFGRLVEQNCPDVKVVYTRKTDTFIELDERARIANRNKADLFVSIHTNSTAAGKAGTQARGTETYTLGMHNAAANLAVAMRENSVIMLEANYEEKYEGFDPKSSESYIIFELMQDEYMKQSVKFAGLVQQQFATHAGRVNRGVHQAGLLVLRATSMPGVLVEVGFINNKNEEQFLNTKDGIAKMSRSIFNAFKSYYK